MMNIAQREQQEAGFVYHILCSFSLYLHGFDHAILF